MSTNSQNVPAPNTPRPRPVQGVAGLVAKSLTGLVNLPGLRDSAKAVHDMAVALKTPGRNDASAQELINRIDRVIARINRPAAMKNISAANGPIETLPLIDELNWIKAELMKMKSETYKTKLACQQDIDRFITEQKEEVSDRVLDFCVDGSVRANQAAVRLEQQLEDLAISLAGSNTRIMALERTTFRSSDWMVDQRPGSTVFGCIQALDYNFIFATGFFFSP